MIPPAHPAADLFPMMTGAELDELTEDIRRQGLLSPIVMHRGQVLDGRNRYRACNAAEVAPRFDEYTGDEPVAYVIAQNLKRRHLSDDQRAQIAAEALPMFEAEAEQRRRSAISASRRGETGAERPPSQPKSRDQAGAAFGVSGRQVQRAKRVREAAPELAEQVKAGIVPLAAAEREVAQRDAERLETMAQGADPSADIDRARQRARWSRAVAIASEIPLFDPDELVQILTSSELNAAEVAFRFVQQFAERLAASRRAGLRVIGEA